jgi:hypothetical protein
MMTMKMSNYSSFFNDNPWQSLNSSCYPDGRRLYLNDNRFWVSVDNEGRIMFFVHEVGESNLKTLENLASISLQLDKNFIDATRLCCTLVSSDDDLKQKFSIVAKDIAHSCSKFSGNELFSKVQLRIKSWANFLKPTRIGLTESEYIGFWGELYVVSQYLIKLHPPKEALTFWVGPKGKKQDITFNTSAIEVKTSMSGDARTLTISSIDQLEKVTSSLFILHLIGSPSSQDSGLSLTNLFETCIESLSDDMESETLFLNKVADLYGRANDEQLNSRILIVTETLFEVREGFPSLTYPTIPKAITKAKYEILLSEIKEFESNKSIGDVIKHG